MLNTSSNRKKRLSDALRQNLLKRKKQQRDRINQDQDNEMVSELKKDSDHNHDCSEDKK